MNRVLVIIKGLGRGGAEKLILDAAPHWDRSRFDYEVAYVLPYKDALVAPLRDAGIPVHCLSEADASNWARAMRRLVTTQEILLVHGHSPVASSVARVALPRSVRMVTTEHNVWQRYRRGTYWLNAITFPRNDHVFAVSDEVRASIAYPRPLRFRRIPPVETLYHGIDPGSLDRPTDDGVRREFGIPDEAPIVGSVANFKAHKGHEFLLRAAARVQRTIPGARFVFVGIGPLEQEIRQRARDLGLNGTVVFTGFRDDVPRLIRSFDVFALSSVYEGLPIALLEAMALGKPSVVTAAGGTPEVVQHGRHALVVPPKDPGALSEGIVTLLTDAGLRGRIGAAARERAADFDIRRAVRRMEQVYEELLA
jgi:glycosyltransferase involved in cell wall biosynthesis